MGNSTNNNFSLLGMAAITAHQNRSDSITSVEVCESAVRSISEKSDLPYFSVNQIQVARENDLLYEPFGIANADDKALVISIQELGIRELLTLSKDGFLLSGCRYFAVDIMFSRFGLNLVVHAPDLSQVAILPPLGLVGD